jgi:pimeloyl-ACP methyl ester carboxylesterase
LIGHSYGALIALYMAYQQPELVRGWIIGNIEEWIKWVWNGGPIETNGDMVDFFFDPPAGAGITPAKDH